MAKQSELNDLVTTSKLGGWLPIETAPKDGTRILIWMASLIKDNVIIGMWAKVEGDDRTWEGWRWDHDGRTGPVYDIEDEDQPFFTHWMPLPEGPQAPRRILA